jgi:hypothetical protein
VIIEHRTKLERNPTIGAKSRNEKRRALRSASLAWGVIPSKIRTHKNDTRGSKYGFCRMNKLSELALLEGQQNCGFTNWHSLVCARHKCGYETPTEAGEEEKKGGK